MVGAAAGAASRLNQAPVGQIVEDSAGVLLAALEKHGGAPDRDQAFAAHLVQDQ